MTAVYAISANRPGYSDYFVVPPSSSYRSPSWMSYPPEPEDLPHQWNDTEGQDDVLGGPIPAHGIHNEVNGNQNMSPYGNSQLLVY